MRLSFLCILFVVFLGACKRTRSVDTADILVSVKGKNLAREEVKKLIPRGISAADSTLIAESLIKKWVKDALVYDMALRNLGDEEMEVDKLVEEYRHSLVRYRYQERLVEEKLKGDIREGDKLSYYEENQKKFTLDNALIKGLFLKIPIDAPGLAEVKRWYKSSDESALEHIEKYSVQNAAIYEYFYDKWVDFEEVMDNIPLRVSNQNVFLKANRYVEVADSSFCYLLNIKEYLPEGAVEPYEYANARITELLVNQRKVEFLRDFEDELYNDAVRSGEVRFHSEP